MIPITNWAAQICWNGPQQAKATTLENIDLHLIKTKFRENIYLIKNKRNKRNLKRMGQAIGPS